MSAERARILFITWDGGGNTPPQLTIARRLVARGHNVRFLCDPTLEADVRAAGCEMSPWTTAPHRTTRNRSGDLVRDYEWKNPLVMIRNYVGEFVGKPAPRWAADTMAELEARRPDVVLVELALPAALIPVEKLGIPSIATCPNIWILPTPGIPPLGPGFAPARGPMGRLRDAIMRWVTTKAFASANAPINATRQAYGLPPVSGVHEQMSRADEIHVMSSPAFDLTSPAMPSTLRYVGPQLGDPSWAEPFRSPWPAGDTRPLVLVGLSSTFQDQVATLRRIVEALSTLPVRAVLTLGGTIQPFEVPGSENVHVVPTAPHGPLLRESAVLVTHCGHGTTMKGLAAGVPLVCMPMGRDQNDTAARVVHRGAGVRIKPDAPVARIRAAVEEAMRNPSYREAAQRLKRALEAGEGCIDPITAIERLAEKGRLRERVKPPGSPFLAESAGAAR